MKAMVGRLSRNAGLFLVMAPMACLAQKYVPPPPSLTVDPCAVQLNPKFPVAPDPKTKAPVCPPPGVAPGVPVSAPPAGAAPSAADAFPFPGDATAKPPGKSAAKPSTADQFPYPGSAPSTVPTAPVKPGSAGDQFPYPGETTKSPDAVPEGDTPRYVPDSPAPGGGSSPSQATPGSPDDSSSSSSGSDSLPPGGDDASKAADDVAPVKTRHRLPKVSAQSNDERVTEDLNVAKFYSDRGNFEAAYLRSKDATKAMPEDAASHFALAQAAEKLRKKDEAVSEYTLYLQLEPSGDKTAVAQKALAGLR